MKRQAQRQRHRRNKAMNRQLWWRLLRGRGRGIAVMKLVWHNNQASQQEQTGAAKGMLAHTPIKSEILDELTRDEGLAQLLPNEWESTGCEGTEIIQSQVVIKAFKRACEFLRLNVAELSHCPPLALIDVSLGLLRFFGSHEGSAAWLHASNSGLPPNPAELIRRVGNFNCSHLYEPVYDDRQTGDRH